MAAEPSKQEHDEVQETVKEDDADSECPICKFVEAGPCKLEHQDWTKCRKDCQEGDKDFVEECKDHFKTFFQCMIKHNDYYEPFLEMFGVGAEAEKQAEQEHGQPQEQQPQEQGQQKGQQEQQQQGSSK